MIYNVTINNKVYEVEVEKGKANLVRTTDVVAAPAPVAAAPVAAPAAAAPAPAAAPAVAVAAGSTPVSSPMPGTILDIKVKAGDSVKKGQVLLVLEAMKMENEIMAGTDGTVSSVAVSKGASVQTGDILLTIK